MINQNAQRIDELNMRRINAYKLYYNRLSDKVNHIEKMLSSLDPENILSRGYSITFSEGKVVKSISALKKGTTIKTQLVDGNLDSTINDLDPEGIK